jgi:hypothetical protein
MNHLFGWRGIRWRLFELDPWSSKMFAVARRGVETHTRSATAEPGQCALDTHESCAGLPYRRKREQVK